MSNTDYGSGAMDDTNGIGNGAGWGLGFVYPDCDDYSGDGIGYGCASADACVLDGAGYGYGALCYDDNGSDNGEGHGHPASRKLP